MDGPASLTRREREVAALVADGLTNREIGERLVISERTAEGHVEQIRGKLGFRSRAQVASWATAGALAGAAAPAPPPAAVGGLAPVARPWRSSMLPLALFLVTVLVVAGIAVAGLTRRSEESVPAVTAPALLTIAGVGSRGYSGDGGPAITAQLADPLGLALDRQGRLYVADSTSQPNAQGQFEYYTRIRRIDGAGTIVTIAGGGTADPTTPTTAGFIRFLANTSFAIGGDGAIYVSGHRRPDIGPTPGFVGRIDANGGFEVLVAAPGDRAGYSGDGGPARLAQLRDPRGLAVDSQNNVYVADSGNNVIRKISASGTITTVAGTGQRGASGERVPALQAQFFAPLAVALSPTGSLYIADTNNHKVRLIDHGGDIVTVAGTGVAGFAGDGGPASAAQLSSPSSLAFDSAGRLYIADSANNRVRLVGLDGTITTVAGDGSPGQLLDPTGVAIDANGTLYISDAGNHRIRKIALGK